MPRPTVENLRRVGNFQEMTRWNLIFDQFPAALRNPPTSEDLNLRCETTEIPKRTSQTIEVNMRGNRVRQPGIYDYAGSLTLTFLETVDNIVASFLRDWREICSATNTNVSNPKEDLEAIITINRLDQSDNEIWFYRLKGCFLEDYDLGTLDGSTSDIMRPSMTISYDLFEDGPLT